jgi:hypothetical protein
MGKARAQKAAKKPAKKKAAGRKVPPAAPTQPNAARPALVREPKARRPKRRATMGSAGAPHEQEKSREEALLVAPQAAPSPGSLRQAARAVPPGPPTPENTGRGDFGASTTPPRGAEVRRESESYRSVLPPASARVTLFESSSPELTPRSPPMELTWDTGPHELAAALRSPPAQDRAGSRDAVGSDTGSRSGSRPHPNSLVERWVKRGDALLQTLAEHGAGRHEYRADLKEGRFVWVDPDGLVSAEAKAQVICSWSRSTSVVAMAWIDPLVRSVGVPRIDGMPSEQDRIDEEGAWRVAMEAAEASSAEFLYRIPAPHAWYFLALRELTFKPRNTSFTPGTPVGLVLRSLSEARQAIESRAEPAAIVRERLSGVGEALLHEAGYAYRDTDWVARLERTGKCLVTLANRLPRHSYRSIAAGRSPDEWLARDVTVELSQCISLLEDEWLLFA